MTIAADILAGIKKISTNNGKRRRLRKKENK
jgi:hypothetical protein